MSRINDALRRARQAQKSAPRVPPPAMPTATVAHAPQRQSDFSLPLLLALAGVLVLAGGLISFVLFRHGPAEAATGANALESAPLPVRAREPSPATPAISASVIVPARQVAPGPSLEPPATTVAVAPPAPPPSSKPVLPVLQGIFYRPDRPTAIIDGRTVRPGASIGGFQVLAITFDTVIIGNATQTNVLRLPE